MWYTTYCSIYQFHTEISSQKDNSTSIYLRNRKACLPYILRTATAPLMNASSRVRHVRQISRRQDMISGRLSGDLRKMRKVPHQTWQHILASLSRWIKRAWLYNTPETSNEKPHHRSLFLASWVLFLTSPSPYTSPQAHITIFRNTPSPLPRKWYWASHSHGSH